MSNEQVPLWDHATGESIEIALGSNAFHRDAGLNLGKVWKPALCLITLGCELIESICLGLK